jgi:hypothetical protein
LRDETVCARDDAASIPEARRYPVAFHRAGLMAMEMIRRSHVPQVVATADARSDVAVRWLKRLGFRPAERQQIAGKVLFVWTAGHQGSGIKSQRKGSGLPDSRCPIPDP